jgi:hypothetical protein
MRLSQRFLTATVGMLACCLSTTFLATMSGRDASAARSAAAGWGNEVRADEVQFYQENGITYRETRRLAQRTVYETQYQPRQKVRFRWQPKGEMHDEVRSYAVPITENRVETRLVGRWNPFVRQPYTVQKVVPVTRYEYRTSTVRVPTTHRSLLPVPVNETVAVPATRQVTDVIVSRVAVSAPGGAPLPGAVAATWVLPGSPTPVQGLPAPMTPPTATYQGNAMVAGNNVQWRPADPSRR